MTVRVHGGLERQPSGRRQTKVRLSPDADLTALQDSLGIPRGEVGIFLINGELATPGDDVPDGAEIDIFPMFAGGQR